MLSSVLRKRPEIAQRYRGGGTQFVLPSRPMNRAFVTPDHELRGVSEGGWGLRFWRYVISGCSRGQRPCFRKICGGLHSDDHFLVFIRCNTSEKYQKFGRSHKNNEPFDRRVDLCKGALLPLDAVFNVFVSIRTPKQV